MARHVCEQVGLDIGRIVLGEELERMIDTALTHIAERTSVFARVSPAQKNRIILLEQGLRVMHSGIIEGRKAFGNVMKYLLMGTSSNFGNMFSMAGASIFLPFLPVLPISSC